MKDKWAKYFASSDKGLPWHELLTILQWRLVKHLARATGPCPASELGEVLYRDENADQAVMALIRRTRQKLEDLDAPCEIVTVGRGRGWKLICDEVANASDLR